MATIDDASIKTIMLLAADAVEKAKSGHPGMPMGDAAMAYVQWSKFLKHNPNNPRWQNRDRFVLSAGHGSMLLYSLLHLSGYDISLDDIQDFRQWESKTPGHPELSPSEGIEMTTGPLGQGFATGVGMAMAERYLAGTFNKPGFKVVDYNIYGIVSDGDLMEGVSYEAASLAGHLGLGKLIYLYSDNKITIEGSTELAFTEDVQKRFDAMGWHTECVDGYDLKGIEAAMKRAKKDTKRPSLILARTCIGYMCPTKQNNAEAHGAPLGSPELAQVKELLGFPKDKSFYIPKDVATHMRKAVKDGAEAEKQWNTLFGGYAQKHPALAAMWKQLQSGDMPEGYDNLAPKFTSKDGAIATRVASGKFLNAIATSVPQLIGGSADLAPSNNTWLKGISEFTPAAGGRNIHFGVREHAMGSICNGMALSGMLVPYCGTFLVFSDYMRPATRLAALMGLRVVYVWTHDSIGLGEDGPTHQPIEHVTSYRAMPNFMIIRPADANETVEAWKVALNHKTGPVALVLSRQNLPIIDVKSNDVSKGGYVVYGAKKPDIILISTGSELHLCIEAAKELEASGAAVRVVSMPCTELFEAQGAAYRERILPSAVRRRVAVEAGATQGWYKYVGLDGAVIGLDRFGASAPAKVLFEKLGITTANIVATAKAQLKK